MCVLQGCAAAHSGRKLRPGEYRDTARQFKRQMKQLGSGSVVAGLRQLQQDEKALAEAARLLEVSPEVRGNATHCNREQVTLKGLVLM
jgi:hypothetical protein